MSRRVRHDHAHAVARVFTAAADAQTSSCSCSWTAPLRFQRDGSAMIAASRRGRLTFELGLRFVYVSHASAVGRIARKRQKDCVSYCRSGRARVPVAQQYNSDRIYHVDMCSEPRRSDVQGSECRTTEAQREALRRLLPSAAMRGGARVPSTYV